MDYKTAIYSPDFKSIPKLFSQENIEQILYTCRRGNFYLKNDWGEWMRARDECIIMLMYHCALRPRECTSLKFSDFSINDMSIIIRPENNKERQGRSLPLPDVIIESLKAYLTFPRARFWQGSPWLFPSFESKTHPLASGTWKGRFRRILKQAGIWLAPEGNSKKPTFSSYTLRHTKATDVLEKTKDIRAVQFMLGHRDPRSTQVYHHLTPSWKDYLRNAMNT